MDNQLVLLRDTFWEQNFRRKLKAQVNIPNEKCESINTCCFPTEVLYIRNADFCCIEMKSDLGLLPIDFIFGGIL